LTIAFSGIGKIFAKYQFTNGGPIILVQIENEYTGWASGYSEDFTYEDELKAAFRSAGVVVPFTFNDAYPGGHFTSVDIWGYVSEDEIMMEGVQLITRYRTRILTVSTALIRTTGQQMRCQIGSTLQIVSMRLLGRQMRTMSSRVALSMAGAVVVTIPALLVP
jgi:hypothetical protein